MAIRSKPPFGLGINWAHPLSLGLVGFWLLNEQGAIIADATGNGNNGSISGTLPARNAEGITNWGTAVGVVPHTAALATDTGTIAGSVVQKGVASVYEAIAEKWSGSGAYPYVLRVLLSGFPSFGAYDGTNNPQITGSVSATDGLPHVLMGTRVQGGAMVLYTDGKNTGATTDNTSGSTNSDALSIGNRSDGLRPVTGTERFVARWSRALTAAEAASFAADPFQMFARKPLLYKSAAAGPQTASPAAAVASWVVAALAITLGAVSVTPTPAVGTWTAPAFTVTSAATASPVAATAQWTIATPATTQGAVTAAPAAAVGTWAITGPTTSQGNVTASPASAIASWTVPAPATATGAVTASPAAAVGTWTVPAVTASAGNTPQTASPASAIATWAVPAPGIALGNVTASPASAIGTWVVPAATAATGGAPQTASPASALASWIVPTVGTASGAVTASPQSAIATWTVPAVTTTNPGLVHPLKATRVYAGPLVRATRVYAGPLVRATRVETFPN